MPTLRSLIWSAGNGRSALPGFGCTGIWRLRRGFFTHVFVRWRAGKWRTAPAIRPGSGSAWTQCGVAAPGHGISGTGRKGRFLQCGSVAHRQLLFSLLPLKPGLCPWRLTEDSGLIYGYSAQCKSFWRPSYFAVAMTVLQQSTFCPKMVAKGSQNSGLHTVTLWRLFWGKRHLNEMETAKKRWF